jgi:hypothetical protein
MVGMNDPTPNAIPLEPDDSVDGSEGALARFRAQPTTDNLVNYVLSYAGAATARVERLTERLARVEAEVKALRGAAAAQPPARPRLRPSAAAVPTAAQGGV